MLDKFPAKSTGAALAFADEMAVIGYAELPRAVVAKVKELLLGGLGDIIRGARESPAQALARVLTRQGGEGEASAVATPKLLPAAHAGFINGVSAHGAAIDEAREGASTRTGAIVIPAALAMGETTAADGKAFVAAIVAGYETAIRIDRAVNPGDRARGQESSGVTGVFGAAAVAGKLLGLDADGLAHALYVAGTQASGLMAFQNQSSAIEHLSLGRSVYNGILAAQLVRDGFSGPADLVECLQGFARAFGGDLHLDELTHGLGREYHILKMGRQPQAAGRWTLGTIDAVAEIARKTGVTASEVDTGTCELQNKWHAMVDPIIGERRAGEIAELVANCEALPTLDVLTAILPTMAREVA